MRDMASHASTCRISSSRSSRRRPPGWGSGFRSPDRSSRHMVGRSSASPFLFMAPICARHAIVNGAAQSADVKSVPLSDRHTTMKVVKPIVHFVDDDQMFRRALTRVLELGGYEVRAYESAGAFLLANPVDEGPSCILLDLQMPGPTGIELHEVLARRGDALPVIFLTGFGDVPTTV